MPGASATCRCGFVCRMPTYDAIVMLLSWGETVNDYWRGFWCCCSIVPGCAFLISDPIINS